VKTMEWDFPLGGGTVIMTEWQCVWCDNAQHGHRLTCCLGNGLGEEFVFRFTIWKGVT
jgi:hypothetical protein